MTTLSTRDGRDMPGTGSSTPRLPKGHTSILSPQFKYVPAASTDVAATFARVRGQALQPQPAPLAIPAPIGAAADRPELNIEVLEASWLARQPSSYSTPRRH